MEVAIPHTLDRDTVRSRLRNSSHKIASGIPGGMAEVTTSWPGEDRMDMSIAAMGQTIDGYVIIEDSQVIFHVALPAALSFFEPIVSGAIRDQGQKLLR
ncbi:hypothetical protein GRI97_15125 [Altererythrobacter xixiisoli]|uniref:Polyhydroxyalkanoic acid system protein n=1 Tax=Croceibacterium xixiisoli TaxID=1476466 RepID=A0A6I4TWS7_9SPHN|nr:polyhydroxyalkanoic acid system family protein [Croceibacterium xixiisoli]MXP00323.1 hypothetical protein [Croceibacterium xixiisoli]